MTVWNRQSFHLASLVCLTLAGFVIATPARGEYDITYSSGHADIGVGYDEGSFFLHYHFGAGAVLDGTPLPGGLPTEAYEFEPNTANTFVPLSSSAARPAGSQWDFLGTAAGNTIYFLPQGNVPGLPFLGIASEDLNPGEWTGPITWALTGFSGPGQFSVWQTDFGGNPLVRWATSDGIGPGDSFGLGVGGHDHFNYGFTAPGAYDVTITATGTNTTAGVLSDTATFRFQVGPPSDPEPPVVPEPASLVLAGMGLGFVVVVQSRIRKASATVRTS
jgi:surface-anchored protein